ncbi:DUF5067 domain-containing protein [Enterococcus mundtii]|uniref:DUF5067 domain-containing protein n=1 Tax=Enterococcus mundtii TaxID=53346 RepID=UPI00189B29DD|nr:DUF5067 domain-containing protein [Enterococcus mundtii]MDB7101891.1 DUF5067 domain-containing protein [Enterococcus mundtii]
MKRIVGIFFMVTCVMGLSACNNSKAEKNVNDSIDKISTAESTTLNVAESSAQDLVTYSDGKLTTPEGIISFTSSSEDMSLDGSKAITILFDYQNTTDVNQSVEYIVWDYLNAKQILDATTESLHPLMMDEESSNYDAYNNTQVEVNPGAIVSCAYAYILVDNTKPLTLDIEDGNNNVIGTREYK